MSETQLKWPGRAVAVLLLIGLLRSLMQQSSLVQFYVVLFLLCVLGLYVLCLVDLFGLRPIFNAFYPSMPNPFPDAQSVMEIFPAFAKFPSHASPSGFFRLRFYANGMIWQPLIPVKEWCLHALEYKNIQHFTREPLALGLQSKPSLKITEADGSITIIYAPNATLDKVHLFLAKAIDNVNGAPQKSGEV